MTVATQLNPLDPEQQADPFPLYAAARREQPVFYAPSFDLWVVTRYEDALAVLKDHRSFSSAGVLKSLARSNRRKIVPRVPGFRARFLIVMRLVRASPANITPDSRS